ncbi:putative ubiquitin-like-specific protease 2A isoform X1 [Canna indica]|uniref:Ubiquitin-like-specific protease 2A isoform X1 n=1 Tax=Canna indica TaxID=4628 RepID=A0AAQ3QM28_9LILI|nr:putative ubiquitin-like-specific protease 2A isoform X1 [Canna indica]
MITRQAAKSLQAARESAPSSYDSFTQYKYSKRIRNRRHTNSSKKLDSNLFESLLEHLWSRTPEDKRSSCVYLDCLWFSLYKDGLTKTKVLSWIKKKQIFSKRHIFVPIVCWSHWSLLILCHFGEKRQSRTRRPFMLLLDSLHQIDPKRLEPDIRRFVLDIYKTEGREENEEFVSNIPLLVPKVPQQTNGEECGTFVLYFINLFMLDSPNTEEECLCFLNENWFKLDELESFREEIHSSLKSRSQSIVDVELPEDQHSS